MLHKPVSARHSMGSSKNKRILCRIFHDLRAPWRGEIQGGIEQWQKAVALNNWSDSHKLEVNKDKLEHKLSCR